MNFEIVSNRIFKMDTDYFRRVLYVFQKTNGLLKFINQEKGGVFLDNVNPEMVTINNEPLLSVKQLQRVVFNQDCLCEFEPTPPVEFKIFDLSFDYTFE